MNNERYAELNKLGMGLTQEEAAKGWHFCPDWDYDLVGPTMPEAHGCQCFEGRTRRVEPIPCNMEAKENGNDNCS